MVKLKLSAVPDDKPVKLTITLPASVNGDLLAYAALMAKDGGSPVPAEKLVPRMLERFMATDRAFKRARNASLEQLPGMGTVA